MKLYSKKQLEENNEYCCKNTQIRELTAKIGDGKELTIKFFEMNPNGYSPLHSHTPQHILAITGGSGVVFDGEKATAIQTDDIVHITSNEPHQLRATSSEPLRFICLTMDA